MVLVNAIRTMEKYSTPRTSGTPPLIPSESITDVINDLKRHFECGDDEGEGFDIYHLSHAAEEEYAADAVEGSDRGGGGGGGSEKEEVTSSTAKVSKRARRRGRVGARVRVRSGTGVGDVGQWLKNFPAQS